MKIKRVSLLLFLIILLFPNVAQGAKIQTGETWQYEDNNNRLYNETSIEIVQRQHSGFEPIATAKVITDRVAPIPVHQCVNLSYFGEGTLYITQEAGFPLFSTQRLVGTITEANLSYTIDAVPYSGFSANPAMAFATAESVSFQRYIEDISVDMSEAYIQEDYIISTNQEIRDTVRNYTLTKVSTRLFNWGFTAECSPDNNLQINELGDNIAMQITWDQSVKLPIYITQTNPVSVETLGLDQFNYKTVTYELVMDGLNEDKKLSFGFVSALLLVPVLVKRKTK